MRPLRRLVLRRETLTELTSDELREVVAADATVKELCGTGITVLVHGCPSDPRICHYTTV